MEEYRLVRYTHSPIMDSAQYAGLGRIKLRYLSEVYDHTTEVIRPILIDNWGTTRAIMSVDPFLQAVVVEFKGVWPDPEEEEYEC